MPKSMRSRTLNPFLIPHPVPAAATPSPGHRKRRVTSLRKDYVCLRSTCDSKRTVTEHEAGGRVRCHDCSGKMVSELEMLRNLDNPKMRARFAALGYGLVYTDEGRSDAEQFIRLCLAHVRQGVDPRSAVNAELAPLGSNRTSGTPAMRAFLASVPYYEWLYEETLLRPDHDPSKSAALDVIEAVLDHPLYRNDEFHNRLRALRGDPFAPPVDAHADEGFPDLLAEDGGLPSLPHPPGAPENPFTTLDNSTRVGTSSRSASSHRGRDRLKQGLIRFGLAPLVFLLALGGLLLGQDLKGPAQVAVGLACLVVGGGAAIVMLFGEYIFD